MATRTRGSSCAWVGRFGLFVLVALMFLVVACHPRFRHVVGVHSPDANEWVCVEMETSAMTFQDAFDTVFDLTRDSRGWQSLDTINFIFVGGQQCSEGAGSLSQIEVKIWDSASGDGPCSSSFVACVTWEHDVGSHGESTDYDKIFVHFGVDSLDDTDFSHLVSHELGHVVGLADPTAVSPYNESSDTAELCLVDFKLDLLGAHIGFVPVPVVSVMHDTRCPQVPPQSWPTIYDKASVDNGVVPK